MEHVIRKGAMYVAYIHPNATSGGSYTSKINRARVYPSREAAELDLCPENECAVPLHQLMQDLRPRNR